MANPIRRIARRWAGEFVTSCHPYLDDEAEDLKLWAEKEAKAHCTTPLLSTEASVRAYLEAHADDYPSEFCKYWKQVCEGELS